MSYLAQTEDSTPAILCSLRVRQAVDPCVAIVRHDVMTVAAAGGYIRIVDDQ